MTAIVSLQLIADLTADELAANRALTNIVYPADVVAAWPGRHIEWSTAEWCVRFHVGGMLCSYIGIVVRHALVNGIPLTLGGVGGVKTHPEKRCRGYATRCLRRAEAFFHAESEVAFALLVCEPVLVPLYARSGWREFGGRLLVEQSGDTVVFDFNRVMTLGIRHAGPDSGTIDLRGPPW